MANLAKPAPPRVSPAPNHQIPVELLVQRLSPGASIAELRRLSGGASQESWALKASGGNGDLDLIIRRAPGGSSDKRDGAIGLEAEAQIIELAGKAGVPVPPIVSLLEPSDGLGCGFVMQRVEGEALAQRIVRDASFATIRPKLARACGAALAAIARIPLSKCPPMRVVTPTQRLQETFERYKSYNLRRPVFDYALRWLFERAEHLPLNSDSPSLVHGDFRNGNLIINDQGIAAVLDWEVAHGGDPLEDLGWLCAPSWRFGAIDKPVGGFGAIDDLIDGYESAGGRAVDRNILQFWMILGSLNWGISCLLFSCEFRNGERTVERAAIGRRASEVEVDLMMLTGTKDGELL